MKLSFALAIFSLVILVSTSEAVIYKYTDDQGEAHYTNDLSSVPADKLDQVTEMEETHSDAPPAPSYSGPKYPLLQEDPAAEKLKREKAARLEKKKQLEAEYEALLKEKEAMDNDKSFQKRRIKRKYQNRPYIKELVAREAEIIKRMAEIEKKLKSIK